MKDFIIERELENVKSIKTRNYLNEVVSSYENGNYRAATVVLYSVVIFDLLEKLRILMEIYNDDTAASILNSIQEFQKKKPRDPQWEKLLLDEIGSRTQLLNAVEIEKLYHLNFDRNIAAHPLYDNDFKLISPNREQVRANIRNAFEAVFTKDPLLSKNILKSILEDSVEYGKLVGVSDLNKHVKRKYYNKLTNGVKLKIFKDLWKITFISDRVESDTNRSISLELLIALMQDNYHLLFSDYTENIDSYSNIKPSDLKIDIDEWLIMLGVSKVTALIDMLSHFPLMFYILTESAKKIIEVEARKNIIVYFYAYFLSENISKHIENVKSLHKSIYLRGNSYKIEKYDCIMGWEFREIYNRTKSLDGGIAVADYSITYFGESPSFASSISIFDNMLIHFLPTYTELQIKNLLSMMNGNSQINKNRDVKRFKESIVEHVEKEGRTINFSEYENLRDI